MASTSYQRWRTDASAALDEITAAHVAVGGTDRGRRYATQQLNYSYAILLASQFQGFCRDLHTECIDHLVALIPSRLQVIVRDEFGRSRQLDRGNAQPGSIGSDFGRLGIDLWQEVDYLDQRNVRRRNHLLALNDWRNAIVHQDFRAIIATGGLRLGTVQQWRSSCNGLAKALDGVMRQHLTHLAGMPPWL